MKMVVVRVCALGMLLFGVVAFGTDSAMADQYTSPNYTIDASVMNNFGDATTSAGYKMVASGGESIVGSGSGGSYMLDAGYVAQLAENAQSALEMYLQPSGLVASYQFDEGTGSTAYDSSRYTADGTLTNSPTWSTGKLGGALTFNGTTQAVGIGNTSQTQLTSAGTIQAWVKTSTGNATMPVVAKADNFWLGFDFGKVALYDWTSAVTCSTTASYNDDSWHHIAITLDSGVTNGSKIYVDGSLVKSCTWTPQSQTGWLSIGAISNNSGASYSQFYTGSIDDVKIFNRILSADEIEAGYAANMADIPSGISLGAITPGTSSAALFDAIVSTDATGYTLSVSQDQNLTSATDSIAAISGTISDPVAWSESSTTGLGFTLLSTNATAIPGKWSSGNAYAAFPDTDTSFYQRTGQQSSKDWLSIRMRADVPSTQDVGDYSNLVTISGTVTP